MQWRERLKRGWLLATTLALVGCGARANEQPLGGESHFLADCNSSCGNGLHCIEGVCTRDCDTDASCDSVWSGSRCVVHGNSAGSACDVTCTQSSECAALGEAFVCSAGSCRQAALPQAPSPGVGGSGSSSGAGADGAASATAPPAPNGGAVGIEACPPILLGCGDPGVTLVVRGTDGAPVGDVVVSGDLALTCVDEVCAVRCSRVESLPYDSRYVLTVNAPGYLEAAVEIAFPPQPPCSMCAPTRHQEVFLEADGSVELGCCADLMNDVSNCGSCGHACRTGALCVDGVCTASYAECFDETAGFATCEESCRDQGLTCDNFCGSVHTSFQGLGCATLPNPTAAGTACSDILSYSTDDGTPLSYVCCCSDE